MGNQTSSDCKIEGIPQYGSNCDPVFLKVLIKHVGEETSLAALSYCAINKSIDQAAYQDYGRFIVADKLKYFMNAIDLIRRLETLKVTDEAIDELVKEMDALHASSAYVKPDAIFPKDNFNFSPRYVVL